MKHLNREKLWSYLDKCFNELGEEFERQHEKAKKANREEMVYILDKMTAITERRDFIIELKNQILKGRFE